MTTKTTYIAFDGKEFDTEEDCRNYEKGGAIPKGVAVFDEDFRRTVDPNKAIYIIVTRSLEENENALLLNWINSADCADEIEDEFFEKGVHIWDYYSEAYNHVPQDEFDNFKKAIDLAEKAHTFV